MKLMTEEQEERLCRQHAANKARAEATLPLYDFRPILKLFGGSSCTWLITEYDRDSGLFFGLCDLGKGYPELGYVALSELEELRFPPLGLPVESDRHFVADRSLREYAELASKQGRIST